MELSNRADSIEASAKRLAKLVHLKAPGLIIENERHLLLKKLISFPAEAEHINSREHVDSAIQQNEQSWLEKHGYYDQVSKELGLDDLSATQPDRDENE